MTRQPGRLAGMHWGLNAFLVSALALAGLIALLWQSRPALDRSPVFIYVAAGLKGPVEEIVRDYKEEFDIDVKPSYGGSGEMLTSAKISGACDLFLPADFSYIEQARKQELLDEDLPVATMKPVVAVRKGNPKNIHTLDDLLRADVKLAQANPEVAAVGKITKEALQKT